MAEKKIVTLGIRMAESMLKDIKALAEAKGMTEAEFGRMCISKIISEERDYYLSLHSIFGQNVGNSNKNNVNQCETCQHQSEIDYDK